MKLIERQVKLESPGQLKNANAYVIEEPIELDLNLEGLPEIA
jgi:hypothetical protein